MKIHRVFSRQEKELVKKRQNAIRSSELASNDSVIDRKIADLRSLKASQRVLAVRFKRVMLALTKAKRLGNKKRIKKLEQEMAHIDKDYKFQDDILVGREAELSYLTSGKIKKGRIQRDSKKTRVVLERNIEKAEELVWKLMEEIEELKEDGFPSPRLVLHKEIEATETNIELARLKIQLEKLSQNDSVEIEYLKNQLLQDQRHLSKLKTNLKKYE